jgi:hypothetical protein
VHVVALVPVEVGLAVAARRVGAALRGRCDERQRLLVVVVVDVDDAGSDFAGRCCRWLFRAATSTARFAQPTGQFERLVVHPPQRFHVFGCDEPHLFLPTAAAAAGKVQRARDAAALQHGVAVPQRRRHVRSHAGAVEDATARQDVGGSVVGVQGVEADAALWRGRQQQARRRHCAGVDVVVACHGSGERSGEVEKVATRRHDH